MAQIKSVTDLVRQIKLAISRSQQSLQDGNVRFICVDLEIKTAMVNKGEAGFKFDIMPIELAGAYQEKSTQTISMSLVPEMVAVQLLAPVSDQLRDAIELVNRTVQQAAETDPQFDLKEATITLEFGITKDGSIKMFIGGKAENSTSHRIKLTLGPSLPSRR